MSVARHPRPPELVDVPIEDIMQKFVGRFREKKPDWAAFEDAKIEGFKRAQHRFIGAGGSGKHADPTIIPAKNFTLSIMYVEPGQGNAAHTHEVEEVFFVLQGILDVFVEDEVGKRLTTRLGPWECISCPAGVIHGYQNDSLAPVYFQVMLGRGKPEAMGLCGREVLQEQRRASQGGCSHNAPAHLQSGCPSFGCNQASGFRMRGIFTAFAVLLLTAAAAGAQAGGSDIWPQRQVTIVVPFAAGGSADLIGRILQHHLQAKTGVPVVVENKSGAGGSLGAGFVAKAPADGYTLLIGTVSTNAINAFLYSRLNFDVGRDLQAISLLVRFPNLLFVNPRIPARSVPELIAYLKSHDGQLNYGSSGIGTSSHLSVVMLELATGTKMTHIPFRSTAEEMNNMIGGQLDLAIDSMTTTWPFAQAGQVRALAVTTPQRAAAAPDLPTIGETLPGYEATGWQGLFAPAGTPRPIIDAIAAQLDQIWASPDVIKALQAVGAEPVTTTPDEFTQYTRTERTKWGEVVKAAGVKLE